jgi:arylformamidase
MDTNVISLSRRSLLKKLAFAGATAVSTSLPGCALSEVRGPDVWLDLDQKELDDAYSQFIYAPNISQVIDRWDSNSELVRRRLGEPLKFAYGANAIESLDVFPTNRRNAPVNIFIHGGAWQQGTAESYAFPAELFVNAGVHYVVPDFSWIQDVGDSLYPIVDQLRRAIAWVYHNAAAFGGDPEQLYLSGHSSGGHLAGVMLTTDWQKEAALPANIIKGGLCCSGMFDLQPVRLSSRGEYIRFTDEMEDDLSPIRHLDKLRAPLIVAYGSYETPEFKRQSRDFAAAVADAGKEVELVVAENYNHFEVIETLANPYGIIGRAILKQMRRVG